MKLTSARMKAVKALATKTTTPHPATNNFSLFFKEMGLTLEPHQLLWHDTQQTNQRIRISAPRNSGKTTYTMHRIAWEIGRNPALRVLIVSATDEIARTISVAIKQIITSPPYCNIFPSILPSRRWADGAWTIDRKTAGITRVLKDPTVLAVGAGGSIVSRRSDLIVIEDPIKSSAAIASSASRAAMRRWWHEVVKPTAEPETSRTWVICTRYRQDDIHGTEFTEDKGFKVIQQHAITNGQSYWPARFPLPLLLKLREEDPISFSSQYQNEPLAEEQQIIKPEWLKVGTAPKFFEEIAIGIDLAASMKERADYTAMVAIGRENGHYYVLAAKRGRWTIYETGKKLIHLYQQLEIKARKTVATVESVGMQTALNSELRRQMIEARAVIRIEDERPVGDKEQRLRGISGICEAGLVTWDCNENIIPELKQELIAFGVEEHDDLADAFQKALARIFKKQSRPISEHRSYHQ